MNIEKVLKLIRHGEGYESRPYTDTKGNMTWGIGRCYETYPLTLNERFKVVSVCPMQADPNKEWSIDQTTFILSNIPEDKCLIIANYFVNDVLNEIIPRLTNRFQWFAIADDVRQAVWVDLSYNMGLSEVSSWTNSAYLMEKERYSELSNKMYEYQWALDVGRKPPSPSNPDGQRAWYICKMLSMGNWPEWIDNG
jgi:GH24 family phage-related lysozyme (muramidase)